MQSETGNEILWHVSTLAAIAGPIEAVFEDGAGVAWATEVGGEWWLRLFKKDEQFLMVAGYAQHCAEDMDYTICNWDEFVGDMEGMVAH